MAAKYIKPSRADSFPCHAKIANFAHRLRQTDVVVRPFAISMQIWRSRWDRIKVGTQIVAPASRKVNESFNNHAWVSYWNAIQSLQPCRILVCSKKLPERGSQHSVSGISKHSNEFSNKLENPLGLILLKSNGFLECCALASTQTNVKWTTKTCERKASLNG